MVDPRTDRELVAAHLGGDRAALGAIYDRYATSLHDAACALLHDAHEAADATHDVFVAAATHLAKLRDPDRLRAWLFAVLRNEVYRRCRRRGRQRPTDVSRMAEVRAPHDPAADAAAAEAAELGALVRDAARGLDERDQLLLELSVRHGLTGADLADAVGVTPAQCHVLVHRMRDRAQRSIGALVVARAGRRDCDELDALLAGWDGRYDPTIRKRMARHVERCDVCGETSRKLAVLPMVGAAPAFALPVGLRDRVLRSAGAPPIAAPAELATVEATGFPRLASRARRSLAAAAVAALAVLLAAAGVAVAGGRDRAARRTAAVEAAVATTAAPSPATSGGAAPSTTVAPGPTAAAVTAATTSPTTASPATTAEASVATTGPPAPATTSSRPATTTGPGTAPATTVPSPTTSPPSTAAPAPGRVTASATTIDLGATALQARVVLTNAGGTAVGWRIDGLAAPFVLSATSGTLAPGARVDVIASLDRGPLAEGDVARTVTLAGVGPLALTARVERPPVVTLVRAVTTLRCPWSVDPTIAVRVTDASQIDRVVLSWTGPARGGSVEMTAGSGGWSARAALGRTNGSWTWTATATDARGNRGRTTGTIVVSGC